MTAKTKVIVWTPLLWWWFHRARKLAKKIAKYEDEERYPIQWRNDYVLKKSRRFLKVTKVELDVKGWENIPRGSSLITPNHSSSLDATIMIVAMANQSEEIDQAHPISTFVAKAELTKRKRYRGFMEIKNTFYIDREKPRGALKVFEDVVSFSKNNRTHIVIFPEGTRSKTGALGPFKGGAFRIAKKAFVPIVPVTINNALSATNFKRRKSLKVEVIFHKPIKPMAFIGLDNIAIANKVQKIVQSQLKKPEGERNAKEQQMA